MLPYLTPAGILPPGVHVASLEEVLNRFGAGSVQRTKVTSRLRRILELVQRTQQLRRVFLWGSYVTAKVVPNDIDLMLVMSAGFRVESCEEDIQQVFDNEKAEEELGATVLWAREDVSTELMKAFLDLWQIGRGGERRGIVEVKL